MLTYNWPPQFDYQFCKWDLIYLKIKSEPLLPPFCFSLSERPFENKMQEWWRCRFCFLGRHGPWPPPWSSARLLARLSERLNECLQVWSPSLQNQSKKQWLYCSSVLFVFSGTHRLEKVLSEKYGDEIDTYTSYELWLLMYQTLDQFNDNGHRMSLGNLWPGICSYAEWRSSSCCLGKFLPVEYRG